MFQVSFFHSPCRLFFISPNPMLVKRSPLHKNNNNKNILVAEGLWNLGGLEWLYHAMLGHQAADTNHCRSGQGEFFFARLCVVMSRWAMDDYFPYCMTAWRANEQRGEGQHEDSIMSHLNPREIMCFNKWILYNFRISGKVVGIVRIPVREKIESNNQALLI